MNLRHVAAALSLIAVLPAFGQACLDQRVPFELSESGNLRNPNGESMTFRQLQQRYDDVRYLFSDGNRSTFRDMLAGWAETGGSAPGGPYMDQLMPKLRQALRDYDSCLAQSNANGGSTTRSNAPRGAPQNDARGARMAQAKQEEQAAVNRARLNGTYNPAAPQAQTWLDGPFQWTEEDYASGSSRLILKNVGNVRYKVNMIIEECVNIINASCGMVHGNVILTPGSELPKVIMPDIASNPTGFKPRVEYVQVK